MYKGPMDKDNGMGIVFGSRGWMGQGRATGRKKGETVNNNKKINLKKLKKIKDFKKTYTG